jgi:hypothetical protein
MPEPKKTGRPQKRADGEQIFTSRFEPDLFRVLRGVAGAKNISINEALNEAAKLWVEQYPALAAAIRDTVSEEQKASETSPATHKKLKASPKTPATKAATKKASSKKLAGK